MKNRWLVSSCRTNEAARLAADLGCSLLLAKCLINRNLREPQTAAAFLNPKLKELADPFDLPDMDRAVERLWQARQRGELIVVFGDYDVDGVTSTALLLEVLRPLGWQVEAYLPNRLAEGYGLTREAAENCHGQYGARLILAVDCGSGAHDTIAWLHKNGVEVIVLDHHQITTPPPHAAAVVNPQLRQSKSAKNNELCSAGLSFKLAHALLKRARELREPWARIVDLRTTLDLVALGTIADLAPVLGENRILVTTGLEKLNRTNRPGLRALRKVAQISGTIGPYEVGFQIGPRLNAVGRLETATDALELLMTSDPEQAHLLAQALDKRNRERQQIERLILADVIKTVNSSLDFDADYVIVQGNPEWHVGVVGIVASRIQQQFHRPTIIFGGDGPLLRGSGRSIDGFDLAHALRNCSDLLVRHGGHAMAAGVTIQPENLPRLRKRLNELARACLQPEQLVPVLTLEAEVPLSALTLDQVLELERLHPCGPGNPIAQFAVCGLRLKREPQPIGRDQQHLKLWVTDGTNSVETVWWSWAGQPMPSGTFDLACVPMINRYNGRCSVQLKLLDWRPSEAQRAN
ncbi:MAG: single-stranded-DNA-specific exonuclease RecJ [Verrucomicrobia bacterium]|nr:single-stranded-DNA-specific exonuclease RecJ [Verrucomicrobiota bacterium]